MGGCDTGKGVEGQSLGDFICMEIEGSSSDCSRGLMVMEEPGWEVIGMDPNGCLLHERVEFHDKAARIEGIKLRLTGKDLYYCVCKERLPNEGPMKNAES